MHLLRLALTLSFRDWLHERTLTLCAVLALASMLTPILVLEGVRNGLVQGMREKLLQDPSVLVISPYGGTTESSFSRDEIDAIQGLPGVRFVIPRIREIATDISLVGKGGTSVPVHMEPSAPGEPVLAHNGIVSPKDGERPEIVLSARAAQKLFCTKGDELLARLGRKTRAGRLESFDLTLTVSDILPTSVSDRTLGFLPLPLLEDIQDYRDDIAVPARGMTGMNRTSPRRYASFRLYAKDLDAVEGLARALAEKGIETRTRAHEIQAIRSLDTAVNRIILILSTAVGAGFVAFTLSSAQGAVRRKLRMLGLFRLFGFPRSALSFYPVTAAFLTSISGVILSLACYLLVSFCIDSLFAEQSGGMLICHLKPVDIGLAVAVVFVLSTLAAVRAAGRAAAVDPSSVIREV